MQSLLANYIDLTVNLSIKKRALNRSRAVSLVNQIQRHPRSIFSVIDLNFYRMIE